MNELASDIIRSAEKIAEFMFGDVRLTRHVYHLVENRKLPVFRMGRIICARKSTLVTWIAEQEKVV